MTKKELIDKLSTVDDDATIYVRAEVDDIGDLESLISAEIYIEELVTGNDVQNEATIVGVF